MTVDVSRAIEPFSEMKKALEPFPAERYHLLLPTTFVGVSPLFIPMPTVVSVDASNPREVYDTPGARDGTVCLHSTKLEQIANAGGLDFDPSLEMHTHDFQKEPYLCQMSVGGWYIDSIGQRRLVGDGVTHDLRDGSKRSKLLLGREGTNSKALDAGRQFICEQARSRARARVIRKCMNLASSYRKDELQKPFVAIRFRLNEQDEDVKQALIARAVGATNDVFGTRRALPAPPATDAVEDVIKGAAIEEEPEIPDEKAPPKKVDIRAVIARLAVHDTTDDRERYGDPEGAVAYALRDALGLKTWTKEDLGIVRRKFVGMLFSVPVADLSRSMVSVLTAAAKDPQGQKDIVALFDHLASVDEEMKRIRAAQA